MQVIPSIQLHPQQVELWHNLERFSVLCLHRRFGKTVLAVAKLIHDVQHCPHSYPRGHYFAPYRNQAKSIAWDYLKILTRPLQGMQYNTSDLIARFPNGASIQLYGADNPDAFRGQYSDSVVLDEVAQMPPRIWGEVVRPALADREGNALFIGTPWGRMNLFYELFEKAGELDSWYRKRWTAEETGIIKPAELELLREEMHPSEFEQEMLCSWSAQIRGAFYGEQMAAADAEKRITNVPHDPLLPVFTSWDLGMNDSTAIWFWQVVGSEIRAIDYMEFQGTGLPAIIKKLREKPYNYTKHIGPHDIKVTELGTGVSRWEVAHKLGVTFQVAKNIKVMDGIDAVRGMMPKIWFDADKCKHGIEALRLYRTELKEKENVFRLQPLHDWTSHAADAMRYFAVGMQGGNAGREREALNYDLLERAAI